MEDKYVYLVVKVVQLRKEKGIIRGRIKGWQERQSDFQSQESTPSIEFFVIYVIRGWQLVREYDVSREGLKRIQEVVLNLNGARIFFYIYVNSSVSVCVRYSILLVPYMSPLYEFLATITKNTMEWLRDILYKTVGKG